MQKLIKVIPRHTSQNFEIFSTEQIPPEWKLMPFADAGAILVP